MVATSINATAEEKQKVLEIDNVKNRLKEVMRLVNHQLEVLELGNKIQTQVKGDMDKSQREYYLRQQLKAIQEELGEKDDSAVPVEIAEADEPAIVEAAEVEAPPPDLPDIESLDADSDFTAFLGDNVPKDLAKLALRKLWRTDPVLANIDGLNDYDDDYSMVGKVVEVVKSSYRVGKGYATDEELESEELEEIAAEQAEAETPAEEPAEDPEKNQEDESLSDVEDDVADEGADEADTVPEDRPISG